MTQLHFFTPEVVIPDGTFRVTVDNTLAFRVEGADQVDVFSVNTLSKVINLGVSASLAGTWTFGLDKTTTHTEPAYAESVNVVDGNIETLDPSSVGSENLQDGNFSSFTNWTEASDFSEGTGNYVYLHSGGSGTLTQANEDRNLSGGENNRWYRFTYTLSAVTNVGALAMALAGGPGFPEANVQLADPANGTFTVIFQSDAVASAADFQIAGSSDTGGDGFTIDDVSLVEITGGDVIMGGQLTGGGTLGLRIDGAGAAFLGGPSIAIGTTPALAGSVRIPNAGDIVFRDAGDTVDLNFFSFGASDNAVLGDLNMPSMSLLAANFSIRNTLEIEGTAFGEITHIIRATTTLSTPSGTVATASNFIPDGALLLGITARVITAVTGPAGFDIGDGTTVDRWGNSIAVALGTTSRPVDYIDGTVEIFTAANDVVITTDGVDFTGGSIRLTAHYITLTAPTS